MDTEHPITHPNGETNIERMELKHADSDSVNSIPPPPPPMGMVVPVASEESDDITEAERFKLQQELEQDLQMTNSPIQEDEPPEKDDGHSEGCCEKFLKCLGNIPCPSLLSWIALLIGIGCFTGGLLIATWRTRDLLDADSMLWFMEYSIIGIVVSMFVILTLVLLTGHMSSEPTSRHVFNSFKKNKCARALNIVVMVICYFLVAVWVLATALLATPLVFLVNMFIVDGDSFNPIQFGFRDYNYAGTELDEFKDKSKTLLICYGVAFLGAFFIVNSLIFFIMCISANITHLRDNRFSALNAYDDDVRNSKHSVVDTNM